MDYFVSKIETDALKGHALKGSVVTVIAQALKIGFNILSIIIFAKLLSPKDFGLINMVAPITTFFYVLNDFGFSYYIIQKKDISKNDASAMFWLNLSLSTLLVLGLICASPWIGKFYHNSAVVGITIAFAITFIFRGASTLHEALLIRNLRFSTLAIIQIASIVLSLIISVSLTYFDLGYWPLVVYNVGVPFLSMLMVWSVVRWLPKGITFSRNVKDSMHFGKNVTGFYILLFISRNLDNVLIGHKLGEIQLGLYALAYKMLLFPLQTVNQPISSVAIPILSKLKDDPVKYKKYFLTMLNFTILLTFPITIFTFFMSKEIILVFAGEHWLPASKIFSVLAIVALFQTVTMPFNWLYLSLGNSKKLLRWIFLFTVLSILSFVIGLNWNALGVAIAYAIMNILLFVPSLIYATKNTPLLLKDITATIIKPAIVGVCLIVALGLFKLFVHHPSNLAMLMSGAAITAITYFTAVIMVYGLAMVKSAYKEVRALLAK